MRVSWSNSGCEKRDGRAERLRLQEEADARVPLVAVPVRRVARGRRERDRHLLRRGLQLLQAHDVRRVSLEELEHLQLARADPVDVPRDDLHLEQLREAPGEGRGGALLLVLEEDVRLLPSGAPHPLGPRREVGLGVTLAPQPEISPRRGRLERCRPLLVVGDAERRARRLQECVNLRVQPRRIAEFESRLRVGRKEREEGREARDILLEVRGQAVEDGSELVSELAAPRRGGTSPRRRPP